MRFRQLTALLLVVCFAAVAPASAAELDDARKLFRSGKYSECIEACTKGLEDNPWVEAWWVLKIRAELTTGQYPLALKTYEAAIDRHAGSMPLWLLGQEALRYNDRAKDADILLAAARERGERTPWRYAETASKVALGRVLLLSGADARKVLEGYYDPAKKELPAAAEPHLATGELALQKHDHALAAEAFREAAKRAPDDPDAYYGLARAHHDDSDLATESLGKALELNPRHPESLLFQADNAIDQEAYARAEEILKKVLEVNPRHPRAWAYRAILAHLSGDRKQEEAHRAAALSSWSTNPEVDHLIGEKLSQKYRFAEGQTYQRRALEAAPGYQPAKVQLCQDLLRLGKEEEGWRLAAETFEQDPYNVVAYNLVTLHDNLGKYRTLKNEHFIVRMEPREAEIYGERVLRLLTRAREKLSARYGVALTEPVIIEIFAQQKDFAIRTFGLPGGAGFLGVCFGPVVTVSGPSSRAGQPSNWEAVLWHEFCHTITLHKTHNKMPRWLSEGISVYEERQEVPAWGQTMTPQYRELILAGGATPVSKLSGAFLKPPTPMHLQFAYYESSMVVEYVLTRFGAPALQKVMTDLGNDVPINDALARHTEPIDKLDESFAKWLKTQAEQLGKGADWEQPDLPLDADSTAMAAWNKEHPSNFWGLLGEGRALVAERKWKEARAPLEKAISLYPGYGEAGGPYLLLAAVHRELGDAKLEREMLEKHVALNAEAIEARLRLIEVAAGQRDWQAVRRQAENVLAVNPLAAAAHRWLAQAAEALGERPPAIEAHRTLLLLDPLDPAEHHYRLARLLMDEKQLPAARQEALLALEEAPRYRNAHRLLLEIVNKIDEAPASPAPAAATRPATRPAAATRPATRPATAPATAPPKPRPPKERQP
jgi:tetratricopeptide (TPR) repeat protein